MIFMGQGKTDKSDYRGSSVKYKLSIDITTKLERSLPIF